jgi:hypothetical protein
MRTRTFGILAAVLGLACIGQLAVLTILYRDLDNKQEALSKEQAAEVAASAVIQGLDEPTVAYIITATKDSLSVYCDGKLLGTTSHEMGSKPEIDKIVWADLKAHQ